MLVHMQLVSPIEKTGLLSRMMPRSTYTAILIYSEVNIIDRQIISTMLMDHAFRTQIKTMPTFTRGLSRRLLLTSQNIRLFIIPPDLYPLTIFISNMFVITPASYKTVVHQNVVILKKSSSTSIDVSLLVPYSQWMASTTDCG